MKLTQLVPLLASIIVLNLIACSQIATQSHVTTDSEVANLYYAGFRGEATIQDLPLAGGIRFRSPIAELEGAIPFRHALAGLFPRVRSLVIREQLSRPGVVVSIYDLDLGAPGGAIPMAETLKVSDGHIVEIELLFNPALLPRPPSDG